MNVTNSTASNATARAPFLIRISEPDAYTIVSLSFYAVSWFLAIMIIGTSCCVIKRVKNRLPAGLSIFFMVSSFSMVRTVAFIMRLFIVETTSTNQGLIIAHMVLLNAGTLVLFFIAQDITLTWIKETLKRVKAFTSKFSFALTVVSQISRVGLIILTFIGIGAIFYILENPLYLVVPSMSPGMVTLRSISSYGNLTFVALQTFVSVILYVYFLIVTFANSNPDERKATKYQWVILIATPLTVLLINMLLMVKMIYTVVALYDLTANQTTKYYICSVFTELLILFVVLSNSPMILHKLAPQKVAKETETKEKDLPDLV